VWWIVNVEIPTNPDLDHIGEIDGEKISPGPCLSLQIMIDVAMGKVTYFEHLQKHNQSESGPRD